jgi:hypothetical protein
LLLRDEVRVVAALPRLRRLPGNASPAQDLTHRFPTEHRDPLRGQVIDELGQAPRRERQAEVAGQHRAI